MAGTFIKKLKRGLFMTHTEFLEKMGETFQRTGPVEAVHIDRLEEALIAADAGVALSVRLSDEIRNDVRTHRITTAEELRPAVRQRLLKLLGGAEGGRKTGGARPRITLVVGVNGTGKTTTVAKLAKRRKEAGSSVVLAAADTFRAAAVEQLQVWADRVDVPVVHQQEGADPAALHDVEGYTHREIGENIGVATGTVKAHLHRARRLLRKLLSEEREAAHGA